MVTAAGHEHDMIARRGLMLVLSSPSGAGKTTLSRKLLAADPMVAHITATGLTKALFGLWLTGVVIGLALLALAERRVARLDRDDEPGIERGEALRRYGAERDNSVSEFVVRDVGIKLRGGIPVARAVTGNRQPPGRIGKCRQRCNQRVEPLARHHRADRQQLHDAVPAAVCQRRSIIARPRDGNALDRHAVIGSDQPSRGRAGDDNALHGCERRSLTRA